MELWFHKHVYTERLLHWKNAGQLETTIHHLNSAEDVRVYVVLFDQNCLNVPRATLHSFSLRRPMNWMTINKVTHIHVEENVFAF